MRVLRKLVDRKRRESLIPRKGYLAIGRSGPGRWGCDHRVVRNTAGCAAAAKQFQQPRFERFQFASNVVRDRSSRRAVAQPITIGPDPHPPLP
jgi:hypothetical protein